MPTGSGLRETRMSGDARAVPVPEREFPYSECTVAGSDRAVLDASVHWIDLARWVLDEVGLLLLEADFSRLILSTGCDAREVMCPDGP